MRKLRSIVYVALLTTAGLLAALINPLAILLASISIIAFLAIARQLNFYKIVMMLKNYAKTVSKLRFEIRAKLHTGHMDYGASIETEESSHRSSQFIR
jgi:hypothetical protein